METKKWYTSKMIWLGFLTALLGIIPLVQELLSQTEITSVAILTTVSGIIMVILRVVANEPIKPIEK